MSRRKDELLRTLDETPLISWIELRDMGFNWSTIDSLIRSGEIEQVLPGVYSLSDRLPEQWETLAQVSLKYPRSVICLLSAARFHELTTANTPSVWMAIPHGTRRPQGINLSLQVKCWRNPKLFELGVVEETIAGVPVRITDPARTIVDLFRPYNRMIDERCNEALWYFIDSGGDMDLLHDYAREFGVEDVIGNCVRMASCRVM